MVLPQYHPAFSLIFIFLLIQFLEEKGCKKKVILSYIFKIWNLSLGEEPWIYQ